jgi:hypothetical protein
MKTLRFHARQGDVALFRIATDDLESAAPIPREGGRVVLAHGEVTGHSHAIAEPHVTHHTLAPEALRRVARDETAVVTLLRVLGEEAWLRHEEHGPIRLPVGDYLVVRQREYVPRELPRTVAD